MGALKGTLGYTIILVVFEVWQSKSYEIRCPEQSEWDFKAIAKCGNVVEYFCLLDYNVNMYTEFCKRDPDIKRDITWKQGQKCVFRGNLDGEDCSTGRYQPFKFRTDGNSDCVYKKSFCHGEGMLIHNNGSKTLNTQCRCDHTRGFAFVSKTKQSCYCIPSQEDCSCYKKECKKNFKLSSDYNCIFLDSQKDQSACSSLDKRPLVNTGLKSPKIKHMKMDVSSGNDLMMVLKRHPAIYFIITAIGVFILLVAMVFWKCNKQIMKGKENLNIMTIAKTVELKLKDEDMKRNDIIIESNRCKAAIRLNCIAFISTVKNKDIVHRLIHQDKLTPSEQNSIKLCVGQWNKNYRLFEIIVNNDPVLYKELIDALRSTDIHAELANQIEESKDSLVITVAETTTAIDGLYNDKIPQEIRDTHDELIKDWNLKDGRLKETTVYRNIMTHLESNNCVCIVGPPDYDKSLLLQKVALNMYENEAYDIIPIKEEPSNIRKFYNQTRNQIFVIEDLCGKEMINDIYVNTWTTSLDHFREIINDGRLSETDVYNRMNGKTKILISCNENIYNNQSCCNLRVAFDSYVFLLSNCHHMDRFMLHFSSERFIYDASIYKYINRKEINNVIHCKLLEGKSFDEIFDIFDDPISYVKNDLTELKKTNHLKFCIITLCSLFDNGFEEKWLKSVTMPDSVKYAAEEVGLNLKKKSTKKRIQEEFSKKDLLYFYRTGTTYRLIHDDIRQIAIAICGKEYTECFIKYASGSIIARCFRMESTNDMSDKAVIIYPKYYIQYFDRLLLDLQNGDTYSSFHNIQLRDKDYKEIFFKYCKDRKKKFIAILSQLSKISKQVSSNGIEDDYDCLKFDTYFLDHKIGIPLIESAWEGHADVVNMLLDDMECDINETDAFGRTALFVASVRGHVNVVKELIQKEADLSLCDNKKRTPLYSASDKGHIDIACFLVAKGANIQAKDFDGCTAILKACLNGHKQIVEILFEKSTNIWEEMRVHDNSGITPIIAAAQNNRCNICSYLLDKGANINDADSQGFTPLYLASRRDYTEMVSILLKHDADMFEVDNDGCSAFFVACKNGSSHTVSTLLIKDKCIISKSNWHKQTPFYIACKFGHDKIVEILIKENVDTTSCDEDEKSPLYVSIENGHLTVVKQLLQINVDVNKCDRQGRSPLYVACKKGHTEIVKLLYSKQANISQCDRWGGSPFFVACTEGYLEIVEFLQVNCDSVNICNNNGDSPLYVACEEGHFDVVVYLLKNGADIKHCNKIGRLAIDAAQFGGHTQIVNVLSRNNSSFIQDTE